jgi:protein-serine/threonine kinase
MSTGCSSESYIAPEQFLGKRKLYVLDTYAISRLTLRRPLAYDARLVDVWAFGITYYCLHFQEIPWRVAQPADTLDAACASARSSTNAEKSSCPLTIKNLNPRACRPLIRKMLEPDPKKRWVVEDVVKHAWGESLDVCYTSEQPRHILRRSPPAQLLRTWSALSRLSDNGLWRQ